MSQVEEKLKQLKLAIFDKEITRQDLLNISLELEQAYKEEKERNKQAVLNLFE